MPLWLVITCMWSFQYGHPAAQSSFLPWYSDSLCPLTMLQCVSCSLPSRDTPCCKPPPHWCSILASCPHASHSHFCLASEGCFLFACDCRLPLAWQISQLLCHPVGSTIPSPVMSSKPSLGENPSIGESVPFQGYPSLDNVPQT